MPPERNDSPLDNLERKLYEPQQFDVAARSTARSVHEEPQHWQNEPAPAPVKKKMSFAFAFLLGSAGFFIIAGAVTAAILFFGARSVGSDNVTISTEGSPFAAGGGEDVPISIAIRNANPVPISNALLSLQFPDGTTAATNTSVALQNWHESLGTLAAGETVRRTVHASFFGSENQKVTIPIVLEYKTQDSNATFTKKSSYNLTISTSPVGLTVTTLSEIASGQPLTMSVLVRSNAQAPLKNVAVRASYPSGFSVKSTSPSASDGTLFVIGTLNPGEEREVRVTGTLIGTEGEERVFRFTAGTLTSEGANTFAVSYLSKDAPISIKKPFFSVDLAMNHDSASPSLTVRAGEQVTGLLTWTNSLSTGIQDGRVTVALSGGALGDRVDTVNGFYSSKDKTVLFSKDTASGLSLLNPGDTGNGSFTFTTKSGSALAGAQSPTITVTVSVSGRRVGETGVPETVNSTIVRTIKIAADLTASASATYTGGPFKNTGPIPPTIDKETTYTVMLGVANSVNSVANASVSMTLPSYVRYTGQATEGVKYNESTRTVTWAAGNLSANAKGDAAFQVALTPSASQKGSAPTLTSQISVTGFDRFSQNQIQTNLPAVTTNTSEGGLRSDTASVH